MRTSITLLSNYMMVSFQRQKPWLKYYDISSLFIKNMIVHSLSTSPPPKKGISRYHKNYVHVIFGPTERYPRSCVMFWELRTWSEGQEGLQDKFEENQQKTIKLEQKTKIWSEHIPPITLTLSPSILWAFVFLVDNIKCARLTFLVVNYSCVYSRFHIILWG